MAVSGVLWVGSAWAIRELLPMDDPLQSAVFGLFEAGGFVLVLALLAGLGLRPRGFAGLGLFLAVTTVCLIVAEVAFRRAGWDFRGQERAWRRLPPFAREARTPTGPVYFRRDGPESWTGAVIRASLELRGREVPPVYRDEPVIVARYDRWGFRTDGDAGDWEIAVAGDSFTELGFLPHEQLFTTILEGELGGRVRNLGVSGTGPYTQLHYLREYGDSPVLKRVLIVFFEGNDLEDMNHEIAALRRFESMGIRPRRPFVAQTSLLVAAVEGWRVLCAALWDRERVAEDPPVHSYLGAHGEIPVHLTELLPNQRRLPATAAGRIDAFLGTYAGWARERGVEAWLAFMPCKARVLHSRLRFEGQRSQGREPWWSDKLPGLVSEACAAHGVRFIDLIPALTAASRDRGELVYNSLFEIHLNGKGSECVGLELARQFADSGN